MEYRFAGADPVGARVGLQGDATNLPGGSGGVLLKAEWGHQRGVSVRRSRCALQRHQRSFHAFVHAFAAASRYEIAGCCLQHDLPEISPVEQDRTRGHHRRSGRQSAVQRRWSFGLGRSVRPLPVDRTAGNDRRYVPDVPRDRNIGGLWSDIPANVHPTAGVSGQKDIGAAVANCSPDGRTSAVDERDHTGHSGDQDVHVGETVRQTGGTCEKVSIVP